MKEHTMWVKDYAGNPVNTDTLFSLFVGEDPNSEGDFAVRGTIPDPANGDGAIVVTFTTGEMTDPEAQALLARIAAMLGTADLTG